MFSRVYSCLTKKSVIKSMELHRQSQCLPPRNESLLLVRTNIPDGATVGILTPICPTLTLLWNVATFCGEDVKMEHPFPSESRYH